VIKLLLGKTEKIGNCISKISKCVIGKTIFLLNLGLASLEMEHMILETYGTMVCWNWQHKY
jgi:hypothetical protein